jgi:uncharacterized membrane protein
MNAQAGSAAAMAGDRIDASSPAARMRGIGGRGRAEAALRLTAACWLGIAVLGQLLFATYVTGFYGRAALQGKPEIWNQVLAHGYVVGDTFLNLVLALHLLFAVVVIVGGAVQLLPQIRRKAPALHRWNGRAYLILAGSVSIGGLSMVWIRGTVGDLSQHIAVSLNAVLILGFAVVAWRHARARRFELHRRWALRLFLAVSGVWFFRVGLMFWIVVNQGPVGFDPKSFTGPFLTFLSFAQFAVPLAVLELYFRVQQGRDPRAQLAMATGLGILSLMMTVGIAAAAAIMWLPHLQS